MEYLKVYNNRTYIFLPFSLQNNDALVIQSGYVEQFRCDFKNQYITKTISNPQCSAQVEQLFIKVQVNLDKLQKSQQQQTLQVRKQTSQIKKLQENYQTDNNNFDQKFSVQDYIQQQVQVTTDYVSSILEKYIKALRLEIQDIRFKVEIFWPQELVQLQQQQKIKSPLIKQLLVTVQSFNIKSPESDVAQENSYTKSKGKTLYEKQVEINNLRIKYFDEKQQKLQDIVTNETGQDGITIQSKIKYNLLQNFYQNKQLLQQQQQQQQTNVWDVEINLGQVDLHLNMLHVQLAQILGSTLGQKDQDDEDVKTQLQQNEIQESIIRQDELKLEGSMLKQVVQQTFQKATGNLPLDNSFYDLLVSTYQENKLQNSIQEVQDHQKEMLEELSHQSQAICFQAQVSKINFFLELGDATQTVRDDDTSDSELTSSEQHNSGSTKQQNSSLKNSYKSMTESQFFDQNSETFHSPRTQHSQQFETPRTNAQTYFSGAQSFMSAQGSKGQLNRKQKEFVVHLAITQIIGGFQTYDPGKTKSWVYLNSIQLDIVDEYQSFEFPYRQYINKIDFVKCEDLDQSDQPDYQQGALRYEMKFSKHKQRYVPQIKLKELIFNLNFTLFDNIGTCVQLVKDNVIEAQKESQIISKQSNSENSKQKISPKNEDTQFELEILSKQILVYFKAKKDNYRFNELLSNGGLLFDFHRVGGKLRSYKVASRPDLDLIQIKACASHASVNFHTSNGQKTTVIICESDFHKNGNLNKNSLSAGYLEFKQYVNRGYTTNSVFETILNSVKTQLKQTQQDKSQNQLIDHKLQNQDVLKKALVDSTQLHLSLNFTSPVKLYVNPISSVYLVQLNDYIQSLIQLEQLQVTIPTSKQFQTTLRFVDAQIYIQTVDQQQLLKGKGDNELDIGGGMYMSAEALQQQHEIWNEIKNGNEKEQNIELELQTEIAQIEVQMQYLEFQSVVNLEGYVGKNFNQIQCGSVKVDKFFKVENDQNEIQKDVGPVLLVAPSQEVAQTLALNQALLLQNVSQLVPLDIVGKKFINNTTTSMEIASIAANTTQNDIQSKQWDNFTQYYLKTFHLLKSDSNKQSQQIVNVQQNDGDTSQVQQVPLQTTPYEQKSKVLVEILDSPKFTARIDYIRLQLSITQQFLNHPTMLARVKGRIPKLCLKINNVNFEMQESSQDQNVSLNNIRLLLIEDNQMRAPFTNSSSGLRNSQGDQQQVKEENQGDEKVQQDSPISVLEWLLIEEQLVNISFFIKQDNFRDNSTFHLKASNDEIVFYMKKRPVFLLHKLNYAFKICNTIVGNSQLDSKQNETQTDISKDEKQIDEDLNKISQKLDAVQDNIENLESDNVFGTQPTPQDEEFNLRLSQNLKEIQNISQTLQQMPTPRSSDESKTQHSLQDGLNQYYMQDQQQQQQQQEQKQDVQAQNQQPNEDLMYIDISQDNGKQNSQKLILHDDRALHKQTSQQNSEKTSYESADQQQEEIDGEGDIEHTEQEKQQQQQQKRKKQLQNHTQPLVIENFLDQQSPVSPNKKPITFHDVELLNYYGEDQQNWRDQYNQYNSQVSMQPPNDVILALDSQQGTSKDYFQQDQEQKQQQQQNDKEDMREDFVEKQQKELEYWQEQRNTSQRLLQESKQESQYLDTQQSDEQQQQNLIEPEQQQSLTHDLLLRDDYLHEDQQQQQQKKQQWQQQYKEIKQQQQEEQLQKEQQQQQQIQQCQVDPESIGGWYVQDDISDDSFPQQDFEEVSESPHSRQEAHLYYQFLDGNLNIQDSYIDYIHNRSLNVSILDVFPDLQQYSAMIQLFGKEKSVETFLKQNQIAPANMVFDLQDIKISAIVFEYGAQRDHLVKGQHLMQDEEEWLEINDELVRQKQKASAERKNALTKVNTGSQTQEQQQDQIEPDEFLSYPRIQFKVEGLQLHWSVFYQAQSTRPSNDGSDHAQTTQIKIDIKENKDGQPIEKVIHKETKPKLRISSNSSKERILQEEEGLTNFIFVSVKRMWISDFHPTHPTALTWRLIFRSNQYDMYKQKQIQTGMSEESAMECYPDLRLTYQEKIQLDGIRKSSFHIQTNNWRVKLDQQVLLLIQDTLFQKVTNEDDDIIIKSQDEKDNQSEATENESNPAYGFEIIEQVEKKPVSQDQVEVRVDSFNCVADYYPRFLDMKALKKGSMLELLNVVPLAKIRVKFKKLELNNKDGGNVWEKLVTAWLADLSATQKENFVRGIPAVKQLWSILEATVGLVKDQKSNKRDRQGLSTQARQAGPNLSVNRVGKKMESFLRVVLFESLDLAAQVASGTHILLEGGKTQLQQTLTLQDGLTKAALSLKDAFNNTLDGFQEIVFAHHQANYLVKTAQNNPSTNLSIQENARLQRSASARNRAVQRNLVQQQFQRGQNTRSLGRVMLTPLSGAAAALRYTLQGIRNAVEQQQNDETDVFSDW